MKTTTPSRSASARRFVPVAVLLITTTLNITAAEADKNTPEPTDSHLVELPELVVTARRIEEHPLDVPAYTNVITREQIEKSGASNLIELLKSQANLNFTSLSSSPTNTKVSMRGTGNGDNNGRALILIDGIRANRPDMGSFNWLQFAVQDIESIEVIQGPQGGYYGDNAVGGVIKINTRGAPAKSGGQVNALVGSNSTVKTSGSYTQAVGNAWTTVSAGHDESEGYRNHSDYMADSGAMRFGYDNKKNSATQVGVSYIATEFEQPRPLTAAQYHADPSQSGGGFEEGWSKTYRVNGSNQLGAKDQGQLLTDAGYFRTTEFMTATRFGSTLHNRKIEGGSFSPKVLANWGDFRLTTGADFNYDQLEAVTSGGTFGDVNRLVMAPYIGGEWLVDEKWSVSGVARHEFDKINAEGINTPPLVERANRSEEGDAFQVAVNYRPTKSSRVYAKYDHTYRFPSTDEIAYYQGFSSAKFFNADLMPESSDNIELGGDYSFGFWTMGGAAYHMITSDEIAFSNSTFLNENITETERNGVQAHVVYDRCTVGFRARADVVDAQVVADPVNNQIGRIPMVPRWQTTETVFARPLSGLVVELTHRYVGESTANSTTPGIMPAASFFDFKVSYDVNFRWSVYSGVNNIADKKSMAANFFGDIYPNEGRFIYLGSAYKF